ncbi:MAG: HTTM domain-containing protein [Verrucomicrobiales bacterium]|nr:HTTM domain-containing protein [Verrucomicrobiales bacterium]
MSQPDVDSNKTYRPFPAFSLVWGISTLIHQLAFTFWTESWQGWVLVAAAIAVIWKPSCTVRFVLLVLAALVNLWNKLPFVPNHVLYEGMLHLIILLGAISFFWKGQGRRALEGKSSSWKKNLPLLVGAIVLKSVYFLLPESFQGHGLGAITTLLLLFGIGRLLSRGEVIGGGEDFLSRFSPVIRAAVVIMYVWAVVQKLNWDYFNADVTCAGQLHREINAYFGSILPEAPWALVGAAIGSLVFELGIPLLLIYKRTRFIGFVVAVGFHLWLSIHPAAGIYSFSSLILAFLLLFMPLSWGEEMQALWNRQLAWLGKGEIDRGRKRAKWIVIGVFFVTLITQGVLYLTIARSYEVFDKANRIGFFAFFAWGLWIGGCYLIAGWKARPRSEDLPSKLKVSFVWIGLIPVLLNGVQPWIGGRTQTSFSMYSNLRSEGEGNHMFLERIDLLDLQVDMVEVVQSAPNILGPSDRPRGIQQFANIGHRIIPWFEFRRLVSEMGGDFEVDYTRDGELLKLGRKDGKIFGDETAFVEIPLLQRKFLWFRRLESLEGPMSCTH